MYGKYGTLKNIPKSKIKWAIQQCENTVNKNEEKKELELGKKIGELLQGKKNDLTFRKEGNRIITEYEGKNDE